MTQPERIVRTARVVATVLLVVPLALVLLAPFPRSAQLPDPAIALTCLTGLVTPALTLHRYRAAEERILAVDSIVARALLLRRVTLGWLSVSGAAALAGGVVYGLSGDLRACLGPVLHLLVGGAVWPTAARVERLVERASA